MKKYLFLFFAFMIFKLPSSSQKNYNNKIDKQSLKEFELLNLCHCHGYLMLRHYDYVKWTSEKAKKQRIDEEKYLVFGQYVSSRQSGLYYQQKYDSSEFYKLGLSIMLDGPSLNFSRLDNLYYEPIVQHYIKEEKKTNPVPYLGIRHNNFFWDCFYKVKEIPLEVELKHFIQVNKNN